MSWSIAHPDATANCTIKLCVGADADDCKVLQPTDGSGKNTKGKFPCGRISTAFEGKEIRFPTKETCDVCTLQVTWETKASGKLYMCSDISITSGKIDDCAGQCMNGGMCLNGKCNCRKGFEGNFCQVVAYVPDKTNYTK